MSRRYLILSGLLMLILLQPQAWAETKRIALVIGNSDYQSGRLKNPVNDANAISAKLKSLGFKVQQILNADKRRMKKVIAKFGQDLLQAETVGLFYYAGHGVQVDEANYLIPIGAQIEDEADVEFEAIAAGRILKKMQKAGNGLNLVILDACRDNPYASVFRGAKRVGLSKMNAPKGTLVLYAAAPGEKAHDGKGINGLFTSQLLKIMDKPGLSIESVFKQTTLAVYKVSGYKQFPWTEGGIIGDFYFSQAPLKSEPISNIDMLPAIKHVNYADGEYYKGQLEDGRRHGQGTLSLANGEEYTGQWKHDKRNGQGTNTWPDGEQYIGQYIADKRHGQGTNTWPNGDIYIGQWKHDKKDGQGTLTLANGEKYVGRWVNDQRHGQGVNTWPDGEQYAGQWVNDERHGQGNNTWSDGDKYAGQWQKGKRNGQGTQTWANGEKYVGHWLNDKQNGQGTLILANGEKYIGQFANDKRNGPGVNTWPDGEQYIGEYVDDIRHGQGTNIWSGGDKYIGQWENGNMHGEGTYIQANGEKFVGQWKGGKFVE